MMSCNENKLDQIIYDGIEESFIYENAQPLSSFTFKLVVMKYQQNPVVLAEKETSIATPAESNKL